MQPDTELDLGRLFCDHIEKFNKADWPALRACMTPNAVYHEPATGRKIQGPDAYIDLLQDWKNAFSDLCGEVTQTIVRENCVVTEIVWKGTHSGNLSTPMGDIPATHKPVTLCAAEVTEFEGDMIKETRHYFDMLNMLQQIGFEIPATVSV